MKKKLRRKTKRPSTKYYYYHVDICQEKISLGEKKYYKKPRSNQNKSEKKSEAYLKKEIPETFYSLLRENEKVLL